MQLTSNVREYEMIGNMGSEIISYVFGAGGIATAIITSILNRKKYNQEVRAAKAEADLRGDDFWKNRYDVLQREVENKDVWWKDRYSVLYNEYQNERKLSNEIVKSFRVELNEMRNDYENQRELERKKYDQLMEEYKRFEEESMKREHEYKRRINQLEDILKDYERRLGDIDSDDEE